MCGIAGIIGAARDIGPRLERMTDTVAHRGPDGRGTWTENDVGLGHRRLSIFDLSAAGAQPMHYRDRYVISFNGAIYNFHALRSELQASGHTFVSQTDTEVILAAFAQWGRDCLARFNGMWAFAIHDRMSGTTLLARDRFGIKPLFYRCADGEFLFASEIKQILAVSSSAGPNLGAVGDFLAHRLTDHTDETFFVGIERLPAGGWMEVASTGQVAARGRFYDLAQAVATRRESGPVSGETYLELLDDAVRLRMLADVEVGTCLSGGLDSSSVAVLASRHLAMLDGQRQFNAITAVSEDPRNDESAMARRIAGHAGLHWLPVTPGVEDYRVTFDRLLEVQDEPFLSASIYMQACVMQTARANGVKVLLDGQGGDETLLGYARYRPAILRESLRRHGPVATGRMFSAMRRHASDFSGLQPLTLAAMSWFPRWRAVRNWRRLGLGRLPTLGDGAGLASYSASSRGLDTLRINEIGSLCLPALLRYEDRNAMAHAVETRLPFLDYRLVEQALSMPLDGVAGGGWSKRPLRELLDRSGLPDIAWQRRKIGFESPQRLWMQRLRDSMRGEVARSPFMREFVSAARLQRACAQADDDSLWRMHTIVRWAAVRL